MYSTLILKVLAMYPRMTPCKVIVKHRLMHKIGLKVRRKSLFHSLASILLTLLFSKHYAQASEYAISVHKLRNKCLFHIEHV